MNICIHLTIFDWFHFCLIKCFTLFIFQRVDKHHERSSCFWRSRFMVRKIFGFRRMQIVLLSWGWCSTKIQIATRTGEIWRDNTRYFLFLFYKKPFFQNKMVNKKQKNININTNTNKYTQSQTGKWKLPFSFFSDSFILNSSLYITFNCIFFLFT